MTVRRILIAVDESEGAAHAMKWGAALASELKAEVIAIYAVQPPLYANAVYTTVWTINQDDLDAAREEVKRLLETTLTEPLRAAGVSYSAVIVDGFAANVIIEAAKAHAADLIVVGSRGRGGFAGLVVGSVSQQVMEHADCPVVVVRPIGKRAG